MAQPPKILLDRIGFLLIRCSERAIAIAERHTEKLGVTPRQFTILLALSEEDGVHKNQGSLGESLGIHKNVMTKLMDDLVNGGFVSRAQNPENRRESIIALTAKGQKILPALRKEMNAAAEELLQGVPARGRKFFEVLHGMPAAHGAQGRLAAFSACNHTCFCCILFSVDNSI